MNYDIKVQCLIILLLHDFLDRLTSESDKRLWSTIESVLQFLRGLL